MDILDFVKAFVGDKLPQHFTHEGRRYPLGPIYDFVEGNEDAQDVLGQVLLESESVGSGVDGVKVPIEDDNELPLPLPEPTNVALPRVLHIAATGARRPMRLGGTSYFRDHLDAILAGTRNLNKDARIWFDVTPEPDTVKSIPSMIRTVTWRAEIKRVLQGSDDIWRMAATFHSTGNILHSPRPENPGRMISSGIVGGNVDAGFEGGVFLERYAQSGGYHVPIKFTREATYRVSASVLRPDGLRIASPWVGPINVS